MKIKLSICFLVLLFAIQCYANFKKEEFVSYFASIKSNEVNARVGPNVRYPTKWVFIKKDEPVRVIAKFDKWRKIKDIAGDEGWVHMSMLSPKRFIIITGSKIVKMHKKPSDDAVVIAELEPGVRASLGECDDAFCIVNIQKIKGFISKKFLWGI